MTGTGDDIPVDELATLRNQLAWAAKRICELEAEIAEAQHDVGVVNDRLSKAQFPSTLENLRRNLAQETLRAAHSQWSEEWYRADGRNVLHTRLQLLR